MLDTKLPYKFCDRIECSDCHFTKYGYLSHCDAIRPADEDKISKIVVLLENTDSDFIHVGKLLNFIKGL